jgi:hypothetical protein
MVSHLTRDHTSENYLAAYYSVQDEFFSKAGTPVSLVITHADYTNEKTLATINSFLHKVHHDTTHDTTRHRKAHSPILLRHAPARRWRIQGVHDRGRSPIGTATTSCTWYRRAKTSPTSTSPRTAPVSCPQHTTQYNTTQHTSNHQLTAPAQILPTLPCGWTPLRAASMPRYECFRCH